MTTLIDEMASELAIMQAKLMLRNARIAHLESEIEGERLMSRSIQIHLGTEEGERRKESLERIAAEVGAIGQRGASVSVMMQQLADGILEVKMRQVGDKVQVARHRKEQYLSKGAVINPPKERYHPGHGNMTGTITAIFDEDAEPAYEVTFSNGDCDVVPARALR